MNIQIVLPFLMIITLTLSVPINKLELKKSIVSNDGKLLSPTGKVISVAEKNLKPNKEEPTFVVSEELTFSSTGYPTFDAFDHNSDGFIEFDEFTASDGKDHKSNFQRADTNGDQKLSPEEFSRLPLVVYEPEQFSDTDDEPPVVFLTPPESISRYQEKEVSVKSDSGYEDSKDIPEFVSAPKEETKDEELKDEHKEEVKNIDQKTQTVEIKKTETSKPEKDEKTKIMEGSHFTADDMPVKIDDEDDEEMIEMKDEDTPMEVIDDLSEENHYDIDEPREPLEDEKQMNEQLNSIN
jgi:hypothetical protein